MTKELQNSLQRYIKLSEMIDEIKDALLPLKQELGNLEEDIVLGLKRDDYNLGVYKQESCGMIGRIHFTVRFAEKLERLSAKPDTDQTWLGKIDDTFKKQVYVLDKARIANLWLRGEIDRSLLTKNGLHYAKTASLTTRRIKSDSEVKALCEAAQKEAKEDSRI